MPIKELTEEEVKTLTISELAGAAARDWGNIHYTAMPYLEAMKGLRSINDRYGIEDGKMVVAYFLNNARTWKGHNARIIKAELRRRLEN